MVQTLSSAKHARASAKPPRAAAKRAGASTKRSRPRHSLPPVVADLGWEAAGFDEASPFGLQGLAREPLTLIKPDCMNKLAVTLALKSTPDQIRDEKHVASILARHPEWFDEYSVVHLIEKSLWIQGQSDLVMTLTRNPSQIPDNPPPEIQEILTRAYQLHPQATIWYGVPLFSTETNAEGLPLPVGADAIRAEARRRIAAAQQHALRWGWAYRSAVNAVALPMLGYLGMRRAWTRVQASRLAVREFFRRARRNARRRARAEFQAQREYCRSGRTRVVTVGMAKDTPLLDRMAMRALESSLLMDELITHTTPGAAVAPLLMLKLLLIAPLSVVACDPFLFVELPDEPGKLRHLGHWYWQDQPDGSKKLHLHT